MKKVLILSSPFYGYQDSVARAFETLGYAVRVETYDEPVHPFRGINKWRHKLAWDKERVKQENRLKYDAYIKQVYDDYRPDIVFSYNGLILLDERLDYFRQRSKVIIWMYDSVQRADRTPCVEHINHADAVFCFEQSDVDFYERMGRKSYFLPLACDTSIYYPIETVRKDIDILFVGTIYTSQRRIRILEMLADHYPDKKLLFYGGYKLIEKDPVGWMTRGWKNVFTNKNVPPAEVNRLFARTKVALNIHHEQTRNGANQRLFEASGAGAYQICDTNDYIESLFGNDTIGLYHDDTELISQIDWALNPANETERERRAKEAYRIVADGNTFVSRVKEMLKTIGETI